MHTEESGYGSHNVIDADGYVLAPVDLWAQGYGPFSLVTRRWHMFRFKIRSGMALITAILLLCTASLVHAMDDPYITKRDDVSAEAIIADGLVLKPAGIVATIVGSAVFVVTLPF